VDSLGLLLMVLVTAGNVTDRQAAQVMLPQLRERFRKITLIRADSGYTGRLVDWAKEKLRLTLQIVKRSDDMTGFVMLPRRRAVGRTLGWLLRTRRLVRDFETLPTSSEAFVYFSLAMLMSRRLARPAAARALPVGCRGVNRPDGMAISQPRTTRRVILDPALPQSSPAPTPTPGGPRSPSPTTPSPSPGPDSTSSMIRR
jgi:transposase